MAGEAQNKLGELFVDLGVGGVGKTLKALNTVSATFLLTKNTAVQLVKPLVDIGKQSLNSAVEIGKLSASFGTSLVEAQKFAYYLKEKNLSEGLLGDLQSMQNKFTQIKMGFAGVDGQMAMSMNMLGLDWQNYDGSAQSMLQYVKDVQNAVKGMSANEARMHLQNLGLGNTDWLYAFQRGDFNLNDSLRIDDATIQSFIDTQEQLNKLGNEVDQVKNKVVKTVLDKGGSKLLNNVVDAASKSNTVKDFGKNLYESTDFYKDKKTQWFHNTNQKIKNLNNTLPELGKKWGLNKSGSTTGQAAPIDLGNADLIGSMNYNPLSNLTSAPNQNIEINNSFNISGDNAQEIADKVASIDKEQLQYNQYQTHNMAGI